MNMTLAQQIITVIVIVSGTMLTRFLPFVIFPADKPTPKYIQFLGKHLSGAVFGLLVLYCLKNVDLFSGSHGLADLIAVLSVIIIHLWKKQMLFSILTGTVVYMVLVQFVF